jgi:hypothetical protein
MHQSYNITLQRNLRLRTVGGSPVSGPGLVLGLLGPV